MQMPTRSVPTWRGRGSIARTTQRGRRQSRRHPLAAGLIAVFLAGGLWALSALAANRLAPQVILAVLPTLQTQLDRLGVELSEVSFGALRVSPALTSIELEDVRARLDLNPGDRIELGSAVAIARVDLGLTDLTQVRGHIRASGLEIRLDPADRPTSIPFDRFETASLRIGDLPLGRPQELAGELRSKIRDLFFEGRASGDVEFSGDVVLDIEGETFQAHLYTDRDGDQFRLRFRESDIRAISDDTGMALVPEQIEIVSLYPLRAPIILSLTERARSLALQHEPDDIWMQDAHRHVAWSFLLTEAFGPDFATRVTNAQEQRPGNTPNERAMDYHNNAVGRQLVADRVALGALAERVRSDPRIIRHPDEVDGRNPNQLLR
jgi:hypothetical protein